MRLRRRQLAPVVVAVALATTATAAAKGKLPENRVITPGVGVGVVQLGDPMAEASAAWGVAQFCFDRGDAGESCVWDSRVKRLAIGPYVAVNTGESGAITLIAVAKPGWKTKQGIGVGSTRAKVLAAYKGWPRLAPGVKIEEIQLRHGGSLGSDPSSVTQFHFSGGRVSMISILAWEQK